MAPGPLHRDLVGDAGDNGHQHDARHNDEHELRQPVGHPETGDDGIEGEDGVHENGDDHDHDEEGGAAAHVQARELPGVLGGHRQAVLEAVDGLVLGAMVHEHALDVLHPADEPDVEHEHGHAQKAVHDIPGQRVIVVLPHDEVRDGRRRHDEQHHAQHEAHHHGDHHLAVPELLIGGRAVPSLPPSRRIGLAHHLQSALGTQAVHHLVGVAEIALPIEAVAGSSAFAALLLLGRHGRRALKLGLRFHESRLGGGLLLALLVAEGMQGGDLQGLEP